MSVLPCRVTSTDISSPSWFTTSRGRDLVFFKVKLPLVKCIPFLERGMFCFVWSGGSEKRPRHQDGVCRTMCSCMGAGGCWHGDVIRESMLRLPFVWECHSTGETTPASEMPLGMRSHCRSDLRELAGAGFVIPLTRRWLC